MTAFVPTCSDREPLIRDGLVLGGSGVLRPSYRVTPFTSFNERASKDSRAHGALDAYLSARFAGRTVRLTPNGRAAIGRALRALRLRQPDCVTILTTSGNHYVSGCVTREIDAVCRWSRVVEPATKAVLIVHEFGYPFSSMSDIRSLGLPVIEDCCYAFCSQDHEGLLGRTGAFVVLSFPKYFASQYGGALVCADARDAGGRLSAEAETLLRTMLDPQVATIDEIAVRRQSNFSTLRCGLASLGCQPSFPECPGHVPGVFLFDVPVGHDLPALKRTLLAAGVECGVFYGRQAFFVPVHQNLSETDLAYICQAVAAGLTGLLEQHSDA